VTIDGFVITNGFVNGTTLGADAAGIVNYSSSPVITNCLFSGNVGYNGGAMSNNASNPVVTNCIFNGNRAQLGGGMCNVGSNPLVINCTFTRNTAMVSGGGLYNQNSSPYVRNSIFRGDTAPAGYGLEIFNDTASVPDVGYCLVQGGYAAGTSIINVDPQFVDAYGLDNVLGNLDDSLMLRPESGCIDVGTNSASGIPANDISGRVRVYDGNRDGTSVADMGAYEYWDFCACDLNRDGRCNMTDWVLFGQQWGRIDCHSTNPLVRCYCDLNDDGRCNMTDWVLFGKAWGRTNCPR